MSPDFNRAGGMLKWEVSSMWSDDKEGWRVTWVFSSSCFEGPACVKTFKAVRVFLHSSLHPILPTWHAQLERKEQWVSNPNRSAWADTYKVFCNPEILPRLTSWCLLLEVDVPLAVNVCIWCVPPKAAWLALKLWRLVCNRAWLFPASGSVLYRFISQQLHHPSNSSLALF